MKENKESVKEYYYKNKEIILKKNKEYREKNKEVLKERDKEYREKNKEILKEKRRIRSGAQPKRIGRDPEKHKKVVKKRLYNWRKKNPEKIKVHAILRRALKKEEIFKSNKCEICGKNENIEAHHPDYSFPLQVLWVCRQCHVKIHRGKFNELIMVSC